MSSGLARLGIAGAIGLAMAGMVGHHHGHGILADLTSASGGTSAGCHKLERLWMAAGGNPSQAPMAASIAMAESGGNADATDSNTNGSTDRGYWQINSIHGSQSTYDPLANARAAVSISGNGTNWTPWVTYNTGAYAGRC